MDCPRCGFSNPEGSEYCGGCGEVLSPREEGICSACGHRNLRGTSRCARCGEPLLPPSTAEGEFPDRIAGVEVPPAEEEPIEKAEKDETPSWFQLLEHLGGEELPEVEVAKEALEPSYPSSYQAIQAAAPSLVGAEEVTLLAKVVKEAAPPVVPVGKRKEPRLLRWALYLLLLGVVAFFLFLPNEGLAVPITKPTGDLHQIVESLPFDSIVIVSYDYDLGISEEMGPQALAILNHLMARRARIIVVSLNPQGPALAQRQLDQMLIQHPEYEYGVSYVNLGYLVGNEIGVRALAANLVHPPIMDYEGHQPLYSYPISQGLGRIEDIDLIVVLAGNQEHLRRWVEQVQGPYGVPMVAAVSAQVDPLARPYYRAGQLRGLLSGLVGAAEYESASGTVGIATGSMLSQSAAHLLIAIFILLGNLAYLVGRLRGV